MKPFNVMRLRRPGTGGGGGGFSSWTVSSLPANVTASESDYRLTRSGGTNYTRIVNHPVTRSSGKYAVRILSQRPDTASAASAVGFRNGAPGSYLGDKATAWGLWMEDTLPSTDNSYNIGATTALAGLGNTAVPSSFTELMMEIDIGAGKLWLGAGGVWANSGNPAAGTGAIYSNLTGTLTLCCDMFYPGVIQLMKPVDFITPASAGFTAGWPD